MTKEMRKAQPLLPIGTVMELTNLTARQIRYYEEHELIIPERTDGNRRMFSLNNIDELLEIQELLAQGINIAGIKKVFDLKRATNIRTYRGVQLEQRDLRALVQEEMASIM